jgi:hypothetical protein
LALKCEGAVHENKTREGAKGKAMTDWGFKLERFARVGDAQGVRDALALGAGALAAADVNFAFQAACDEGHPEAARELLEVTGIVSVSRGMRKAVARGSLACVELAMERLARENAFDMLDLGVALRDARLKSPEERACAQMAWERSDAPARSYALRYAIQTDHWDKASWLIEMGARMDDVALEGGNPRDVKTPREAWEASLRAQAAKDDVGKSWAKPTAEEARRLAAFSALVQKEGLRESVVGLAENTQTLAEQARRARL